MNKELESLADKIYCVCGRKLKRDEPSHLHFNPKNLYFAPCDVCYDQQYEEGSKDRYNMGFIEGMNAGVEDVTNPEPVAPPQPLPEEEMERLRAEMNAEDEADILNTFTDPKNQSLDARTYCMCGLKLERVITTLPNEGAPTRYYFKACPKCLKWAYEDFCEDDTEDGYYMGYMDGLEANEKVQRAWEEERKKNQGKPK